MDLEKEFNRLIDRYGLIVKNQNPDSMYNEYKNCLLEELQKISKHKIALYGLGKNGVEVLKLIDLDKYNIVCLIDNNKELHGEFSHIPIPTISSDDMRNYDIDSIIITSFNSRHKIKEYLVDNYNQLNIIDVYQNLIDKGIYCNNVFYNENWFDTLNTLYRNNLVLKYKKEVEDLKKEIILEEIISEHIKSRDFYNIYNFIDEYIKNKYQKSKKYKNFLKDLNKLFIEIKQYIKNKNNKNYILLIVDAFNHKDYVHMPFLNSLFEKNGVLFKNAYSTSNFTNLSFKSIFTEKHLIEDEDENDILKNGILKSEIKFDMCESLKEIQSKGYKIKNHSPTFIVDLDDKFFKEDLRRRYPISNVYWNFLVDYVNETEDSFFIYYSCPELHIPYMNSLHKNQLQQIPTIGRSNELYYYADETGYDKENLEINLQRFRTQIKDGAEFVDKQMSFYFEFLNLDVDTLVLMGDHGRDWESMIKQFANKNGSDMYLKKDNFLSFFGILNNNIENSKEENIFEYTNIFKLISGMISNNFDFSQYFSSYAKATTYPFYNIELIKPSFDYNFVESGIGSYVIFTKTEKYIYFFDGTEKYYLLADENTNLVNDSKYRNDVEKLRRKIKKFNYEILFNSQYPELEKRLKIACDIYINKNINVISEEYDKIKVQRKKAINLLELKINDD